MAHIATKKRFSQIDCLVCVKPFTPRSSSQRICSEKCYAKRASELKFSKRQEFLKKYFTPEKAHTAAAIFRQLKNRKYTITNEKVVDYDSPTGKAFIGIAKNPLQKVKNGFGYYGVLLQTDNRVFIQCHVCGKWFRKISGKHLDTHKLNKDSYQKKFGLLRQTALVADATSYKLEKAGYKKYLKYKDKETAKLMAAREKATVMSAKRHMSKIGNVEHDNRFGLCEKQLGFRLIEYIRKYHALPSVSPKNQGNLIARALYRRYGSVNDGFKHYGLPAHYRQGTNVELLAPNRRQFFFNYNKEYSKDKIYNWMRQNCPVLADESINLFAD